ncbi:MAG: cation transporter dimerization domain-containing protein [Desulfurococcaceae archaeon]
MVDLKLTRMFIATIALSLIGGFFKVLGGTVGGSKSVFVDALTSIANTLAILFVYRFFTISTAPPDEDHHYGHYRVGIGGPILTLMLYSFVAGVVVVDLYNAYDTPYTVNLWAPVFALAGLVPYTVAIAVSKRIGSTAVYYARFTVVEIIESSVTVLTALGGALVSYLVDFAGAVALLSYLIVELAKSFREVVAYVSDAAPEEIVRKLESILRDYGVVAERVRVRRVAENVYHGDIILKLPPGMSIEKAHSVADSIEKEVKNKLNIDIVVHIEPDSRKKPH